MALENSKRTETDDHGDGGLFPFLSSCHDEIHRDECFLVHLSIWVLGIIVSNTVNTNICVYIGGEGEGERKEGETNPHMKITICRTPYQALWNDLYIVCFTRGCGSNVWRANIPSATSLFVILYIINVSEEAFYRG